MHNMTHKIFTLLMLMMLPAIYVGCATTQVDPDEVSSKAWQNIESSMRGGSESTRSTVVRLTGGMSKTNAIHVLKIALKDRNPEIAEKALEKIKELRDPSIEKVVREELGDDFDKELLEILIELGAEGLGENIDKGLRSLRPTERADAVNLYAKAAGDEAENRIREYLNDEEVSVRLQARRALAELGDKSVLEDIGEFIAADDMVSVVGAIVIIRENDLRQYEEELLKLAKEKTGHAADEALKTIYLWGNDEAREILAAKIENSEIFSLYTLLNLIDENKDKEMIPALRKMLSSSVPNERYSAARLIVSIDRENNEDALKMLLDGMESDDPKVREQVAISLGKLEGVDEAKKKLELAGLQDQSPKVVEVSMISLGKIGDLESVNYLAKFLDDRNFIYKVAASAAILNITGWSQSEKTGKSENEDDE